MTIVTAVNKDQSASQIVTVGHNLARQMGEKLVVLHVMNQATYEERWKQSIEGEVGFIPSSEFTPGGNSSESKRLEQSAHSDVYTVDEDAETDAANVAREVVESTVDHLSNVSFQGRVGDPAEEILKEAERRDARYLLIGGRKRTPVGKAVFGSITQSVLLESNRPVLCVPAGDLSNMDFTTGPIIAAVDRSERAERVIHEAKRFANSLNRELHVIHIIPPAEETENESERIQPDIITKYIDDGTVDAAKFTELTGEPTEKILEYASENDASSIVLTGRKQTPVGKILFGSVTQSVILNAERPILTIPSGD